MRIPAFSKKTKKETISHKSLRPLNVTLSINKKGKITFAVCLDIGSNFASTSIYDGTKLQVVESPIDGPQTQTIAYYDLEKLSWNIGADALLQAFDNPAQLACHVKRCLYERPTEKLFCDGKFNAIEVTTEIIKHQVKVLLQQRPDLADFPQFGGDKKPENALVVMFTVPANWSVEQRTYFEKAIEAAGIKGVDGFPAEPVAAGRYASHTNLLELRDGDIILILDVGAGTSDIVLMKWMKGVFHEVLAAGGDAYLAGHDFTNAIAQDIAKTFGIEWKGVFGEGGLSLKDLPPEQLQKVLPIWDAAEEAKRKMSVMESAKVPVIFQEGGRKLYDVERSKVIKLWKPLYTKYRKAVSEFAAKIQGGIENVDHTLIVGGSAGLFGIQDETATALGCKSEAVTVANGTEHAISGGGAEMGFLQDAADAGFPGGFGLEVRDKDSGGNLNVLLIEPNSVIPAMGYYSEHKNFSLSASENGSNKLICKPFACRTGVKAKAVDGQQTLLKETEVIPFGEIDAELDGWPATATEVVLGVSLNPNRRLFLLVRPKDHPEIETVSIPLVLEGRRDPVLNQGMELCIMLVLDYSGSMAGPKSIALKEGAEKFSRAVIERGGKVGACMFPYGSMSEGAKVLSPPTDNLKQLMKSVSIGCGGGTPMGAGIKAALAFHEKEHRDRKMTAVLFSDGQPTDGNNAVIAADELKKRHRLITVAIGSDAAKLFLSNLASSPEDFFNAEHPEDIVASFDSVKDRIFSVERSAPASTDESAPDSDSDAEVDADGDSDADTDDWDDIEADDDKGVA